MQPLASAAAEAGVDIRPVAFTVEFIDALAALSDGAVEASAAALPGWAQPLARHFGSSPASDSLALWNSGTLVGFLPLSRQAARWLPGWPVLVSWPTPLSFSGVPLIAREGADEILASLLRRVETPLLLHKVRADGPFWHSLTRAVRETGAHVEVLAHWERAALAPAGTFESWFEANFDRKRRKEHRRRRARLGGLGRLETASWQLGDPLQPWIDGFYRLEAAGWKGRGGTAALSDVTMERCLTQALHQLAAAGQLRFWALRLDGTAIATLSAIVTQKSAWLLKIAFDEAYAKYSPGVLVILEATRALFEEGIVLADSCADPGHPMIEGVWRDRIAMADVLISPPNIAPARFRAMVAAERLRRRARAAAKDIYHRVSGRRRA